MLSRLFRKINLVTGEACNYAWTSLTTMQADFIVFYSQELFSHALRDHQGSMVFQPHR